MHKHLYAYWQTDKNDKDMDITDIWFIIKKGELRGVEKWYDPIVVSIQRLI